MQKYIDSATKLIAQRFNPEEVTVLSGQGDNELITRVICNNNAHDIYNCFRISIVDGKYTLYGSRHDNVELKVDNIEIFEQLYDVMLTDNVVRDLRRLYRLGCFTDIPKGSGAEPKKMNFNLLTAANFKVAFKESTELVMNTETADNVKFQRFNDNVIITFDVYDRDSIYKKNTITLNDRGLFKMDICEKLEGCGLDGVIQK